MDGTRKEKKSEEKRGCSGPRCYWCACRRSGVEESFRVVAERFEGDAERKKRFEPVGFLPLRLFHPPGDADKASPGGILPVMRIFGVQKQKEGGKKL
ncbi:hypothetical protein E2320_019597 [Naja naja]|nr:hypothetical protein E2320_019597 [Naja naja]